MAKKMKKAREREREETREIDLLFINIILILCNYNRMITMKLQFLCIETFSISYMKIKRKE